MSLPRPTVLLHGIETDSSLLWAWEWFEEPRGASPRVHETPLDDELKQLLAELRDATPEPTRTELHMTARELRATIQASGTATELRERAARSRSAFELRGLATLARATTGGLAVRAAEASLMDRLGARILPPRFVREMLDRTTVLDSPVELRLAVPPRFARVPWGLLGLNSAGPAEATAPDPKRLLQVCIVTKIAPVDSRSAPQNHLAGPDHREPQPLYVVDPLHTEGNDLGRVLDDTAHAAWNSRIRSIDARVSAAAEGVTTGLCASPATTRVWLSEQLLAARRSHLMYLGHVQARNGTGRRTTLELNDARAMFDTDLDDGAAVTRRGLSATDLLAGTTGAQAFLEHLDRLGARPEMFGAEAVIVPDAALDPAGRLVEVPGAALWPMPPRVALIACRSGGDMQNEETFGLVAAMFELGAELVIATRWSLPTTAAFRLAGNAGHGLHELAVEIDDVLAAHDATLALWNWQNLRLSRWRASGQLADAPLLWGAINVWSAASSSG